MIFQYNDLGVCVMVASLWFVLWTVEVPIGQKIFQFVGRMYV